MLTLITVQLFDDDDDDEKDDHVEKALLLRLHVLFRSVQSVCVASWKGM